jgi:SAM-dependent methyltransferase
MAYNGDFLLNVKDYYSDKIQTFGDSFKSVDWNSKESQYLRFSQLEKVLIGNSFSVIDYGCGTGELYNFLSEKYQDFKFYGYDISDKMLEFARNKYNYDNTFWVNNLNKTTKADFLLSSGIFNVKLDCKNETWYDYIISTIETFNNLTVKGFSFNLLSIYSDIDKRKDNLYYADPLNIFDYCKKKFSAYVSLIHDYPLYEFTIIVRKKV